MNDETINKIDISAYQAIASVYGSGNRDDLTDH